MKRSSNTHIIAKISAISAISSMSLLGCQSTPSYNGALTQVMASQPTLAEQSEMAKSTLFQALQAQRKTSFRYRMDTIGSNQTRLASFETATAEHLAMSDNPNEHCEHIHDEAYSDLLARADLEDEDIYSGKFNTQRQALKSAFEECKAHQLDWDLNTYNYYSDASNAIEAQAYDANQNSKPYDLDLNPLESHNDELLPDSDLTYNHSTNSHLNIDTINEGLNESREILVVEETQTIIDPDNHSGGGIASEETIHNDSVAHDRFLPNYDSSHTRVDERKAKLLDAYFLKPTSITTQGVYKPLQGQLSILPTLRYQTRNFNSIANHYIYVDAKKGAVYFWADTFATILSAYFDDELGVSMHNKWLKLDLNDGSLPKGFGKDFILSHFSAKDRAFNEIPSQRFRILQTAQALSIEPKPDSRFAPIIQSTPYVIERSITTDDFDKSYLTYFNTLHDLIEAKYPELTQDDEYAHLIAEMDAEENAENAVEVSSITDSINSRMIIKQLLTFIEMNNKRHSYESEQDDEQVEYNQTEQPVYKNPNVEYATYDKNNLESQWVWRDMYAIDRNNNIQWHFSQHKLPNKEPTNNTIYNSDVFRGLEVQSLTRFEPVSLTTPVFDALPQDAYTPNSLNTIDIREYSEELMERYKEGGGTPFGKIIIDSMKKGGLPIS